MNAPVSEREADRTNARSARRASGVLLVVAAFLAFALLAGCASAPTPVRFTPVEVVVTRPCLAGRARPPEAVLITEGGCRGTDAECVRAAAADILELKREARQLRALIEECAR